ncbi:MAG: cytochrome P450, partial [Actinobacteria bacterium]|nr:cytochrome P450 [Actinomycetota bacterium]
MAEPADLVDPAVYQRGGPPHERFSLLREREPVCWHPGEPGFWAVTRHAEVERVSRDPELFSSARRSALFGELPPELLRRQRLMMINTDPPAHTRLRRLVSRLFLPRVVGALRERIERICAELVEAAVRAGGAEFVAEVAAP